MIEYFILEHQLKEIGSKCISSRVLSFFSKLRFAGQMDTLNEFKDFFNYVLFHNLSKL